MDDRSTKSERRQEKRRKRQEMKKSGRSFVVAVQEAIRKRFRKHREKKEE